MTALAQAAPFDPTLVPFLMTPRESPEAQKRDRSQVDMSLYEGGSASLRNLNNQFQGQALGDGDSSSIGQSRIAESRIRARIEKKAEALLAISDLNAQYKRCGNGCQCGAGPCPTEGMKLIAVSDMYVLQHEGRRLRRDFAWCASVSPRARRHSFPS